MKNQDIKHVIYFNTRDELTRVELAKVVYFESDGNYVSIVYSNGYNMTLLVSMINIEQVLQHVTDLPFVRVGRKHLINMRYLSQINLLKAQVMLMDSQTGQTFPITMSKEAVKQLKFAIKEAHPEQIDNFKTLNGKMEAFFESEDILMNEVCKN